MKDLVSPDAPVDQAAPPRGGRWRLAAGVFLVTLAMYVLTANGHLQGQDQEYYYRMAQSLALKRSFAVAPLTTGGYYQQGTWGPDGKFYTVFAPGLPVALAPLVVVGRVFVEPIAAVGPVYRWPTYDELDLAGRFAVSYFNLPVTAATAALLALVVVRLGYGLAGAAFVAFVYGLATPAWPQARTIFAEPLQGLLLLLAFFALVRAGPARALLGGVALGLAVLVKLTSIMALPVLLLLPVAGGRALWRSPALWLWTGLPLLGGLAAYALYNVARFGSPLAVGYGGIGGDHSAVVQPLVGLYGLLFSTGRGLFVYAPPVIAALLASGRFRARQPGFALAIAMLTLAWLAVHATWPFWDGGWGWGPRFLLPITPLLLLPLAECWQRPLLRRIALGLAGLGALFQIPGATTDFMDWGFDVWAQCQAGGCGDVDAFFHFSPWGSNLYGQTTMLLSGKLDLAWVSLGGTWVTPLTLSLAAALLAGGIILLGSALGRRPAPSRWRAPETSETTPVGLPVGR